MQHTAPLLSFRWPAWALPRTLPGALPAWQECHLAPGQAPRLLVVPRGTRLLLQVGQGQVWLTCEGQPRDHFLEADAAAQADGNAPLVIAGPARLHVGTAGASAAAVLRWRWLQG
ncbi:Protein of unknown function [Oryzisolibacter propanilivorax]|uniref:DUF2917 domain-containing protein n=1 Tax=Oryzisolibacter propanilivorax TaxID=1527607 RepID=A0A1G9UX71_9BURK|nr:DUF2917 domain-containing protein [Oryzisolibacter propanilivorax]SDM64407.1 Protein of unknown function [Oryzisolibacter propanilivorax]